MNKIKSLKASRCDGFHLLLKYLIQIVVEENVFLNNKWVHPVTSKRQSR